MIPNPIIPPSLFTQIRGPKCEDVCQAHVILLAQWLRIIQQNKYSTLEKHGSKCIKIRMEVGLPIWERAVGPPFSLLGELRRCAIPVSFFNQLYLQLRVYFL